MSLAQADNLLSFSRALRLVYGPGAEKKIARNHGVAPATARKWLGGATKPARFDQAVKRLERDLARLQAEIDTARRWIERLSEERQWHGSGAGCALARPAVSNAVRGVASGSAAAASRSAARG